MTNDKPDQAQSASPKPDQELSKNHWVQISIAAIGAVSATLIGYWQFSGSGEKSPAPSATNEHPEFVGRVVDETTEEEIRRAKIILEGEGIPPEVYTDSSGIFKFPLESSSDVRVRVEAEGYENYDRLIDPAATSGIEQIQLIPLDASVTQPSSTPTSGDDIAGVWEYYWLGDAGTLNYLAKVRIANQNNDYLISLVDQVTGGEVTTATAITDVTYNGEILTFQSSWSNGEVANFRLQKLSDTIFEGDATVNGQLRGRSRIVKIQ